MRCHQAAQPISDHTVVEQPPAGLHGSIEQGGAAKVLLDASHGSVSAPCTEHATCPVLVVRGATAPTPS
jgi:hypothetical protein